MRRMVPTTWVYRASREDELPSIVLGRYVRFDEHAIEQWLASRTTTNGRKTR